MSDLGQIARDIAAHAETGEDLEAYVVRTRDTEIEVLGGDVESLSVSGVEGVGVRLVRDRRLGHAWCGTLDPEAIADAVTEARDNARFAEPEDWVGLPTVEDAAGPAVELDLFRSDLADVSTDAKVAFALELERATTAADARVRGVESAGYSDTVGEASIASSLGVEASTRFTTCGAHSVALAGDSDDTQTGFGFSVGRTFTELDAEAIVRDAVERSTRLLGATQPASRRLPIVFDPLVTRSLLALVGGALSGEAVFKGRSMFAERVGEDVAAPCVSLVEDATRIDAMGASPFDAEGVPTSPVSLLVNGRLEQLLYDTTTARRVGTATTGSAMRGFKSVPGVGARALALQPGARSPEEILMAAGPALYVQSVSGLHSGTNIASGDFSVGVEGLMVRDGVLAEPVREVTIASTLQRMLLDVTEIGSDLTWLPGNAAGVTVLVEAMTMSGA